MGNKWDRETTDELMRSIAERPDAFERTLIQNASSFDCSLKAYLNTLAYQHDVTLPRLIEKSCLSKSFVYQIFAGQREAGRDALVRLALAMEMTTQEAQRLLAIAGKPRLYPRIRRDAALILCLEKRLSVQDASVFLESIGEKALL